MALQLSADIGKMRDLLNNIIENSKNIGGFNDGPRLRDEIQSDVKQIMQISQTVKSTIARLKEDEGIDISQQEKEVDSLRASMQTGLPVVIQKLRANSVPEQKPEATRSSTLQSGLLDQQQLDAESEQLEELEQQTNQILATMNQVNQLFKNTFEEIQKQRHILTDIQTFTQNASQDMKTGNDQLARADSSQKKGTKCLCWIFVILGVVVAGVVIYLIVAGSN